MEIKKLNKIKDTSKYYKLLLDFFSSPIDKEYELTDENISLFKDDELFNQFILDLAGRIILMGEEDFKNKTPEKYAFNMLFRIESSNSNDIKEQMKQIRNCFAHSLTELDKKGNITFDNGKIRGKTNVRKLYGVGMLYSHIEEFYNIIKENQGLELDFEEAVLTNNTWLTKLIDIHLFLVTNILAGNVRSDSIKNRKDFEDLLNRGKAITVKGTNMRQSAGIAIDFDTMVRNCKYENMSASELSRKARREIKGGERIQIRPLSYYKELFYSYLNYVGEEDFFNTDFMTQKNAIETMIYLADNNKEGRALNVSSILISLEKLKYDIEKGKRKLFFSNDSKTNLDWLSNRYLTPAKYEFVLQAYMYNRLVYLKELLTTNQIDESLLDYSKVGFSDIDVNVKYSKKEIEARKNELLDLIEACKKRIEEYTVAKQKEEQKKEKMDNPKNPKREELLAKSDEKIAKKTSLIQDEQRLLEQYEYEQSYINKNGTIPLKPITLFRVLRNSTTHGFEILGRKKAYENKNLQDLIIRFEDRDPKTTITMSAGRLIKLIQDIEQVVIENVDRIHEEQGSILEQAMEETERKVSVESMSNTMTSVEMHKWSLKKFGSKVKNLILGVKNDDSNQK